MKHNEGTFNASDDVNIFYQKWTPETEPKAVVQVVHGFAEHGGRYKNVADALIPAGFAVYATDHRGHGKTEGLKGYVDRFEQFRDDEIDFTAFIRKEEKNKPMFLLGHSMGSLIAVQYVAKTANDLKGLVLSGSGTKPGDGVGGFLLLILRILSKIRPKMTMKNELSDVVSRDPEVIEAYKNDPLVLDKFTLRLGSGMLSAFKRNAELSSTINIPLLLQAGGDDKIVNGAPELFEYVPKGKKTLKVYNGLYHEVYNELENDRKVVLQDLVNWLNEILS